MLTYKVKVGEKTLTSLRNTQKYVILANNTCKFIYTETKLGPKFNIKYKISKKHKHDLIYKAQCPYLNCDETFIGEISSGSTSSIFHPHAAFFIHTQQKKCNFSEANLICGPICREFFVFQEKHAFVEFQTFIRQFPSF